MRTCLEKSMIKESLFAAEERETKLDKLGDVLQILEKHKVSPRKWIASRLG